MEPIRNGSSEAVAVPKAFLTKSLYLDERRGAVSHYAVDTCEPLVSILDDVGDANGIGEQFVGRSARWFEHYHCTLLSCVRSESERRTRQTIQEKN